MDTIGHRIEIDAEAEDGYDETALIQRCGGVMMNASR
jgi:hypothetical protein